MTVLDLLALTDWDKVPDWLHDAWWALRWDDEQHPRFYQAESYGMRCLPYWGLYG